jgi:signal transduction histidine kinase
MDRGDTNQAHRRIAARLTGSILFRQICAFVCVDIVIFLLIVLARTDAAIFTGYASADAELTSIVLWLKSLPIFDLTGFWALLTIGVVEALALADSAIKIRKPIRKQLEPLRELRAATDAYAGAITGVAEETPVGASGAGADTEALRRMAESLRSVDARDMETHLSAVSVSPELAPLATAIDEMLARLDASYAAQTKFVADASHELRTPIAVIQGYANMLSRWGAEDPATLNESIEAIRGEAESMRQLVNQLLFLARGDNDTLPGEMVRIDLAPILEEVLREEMMIDDAHEIEADLPESPVCVTGDAALIKQLVRILCDNSVKYTPGGAGIELSLRAEHGSALIVVTDEGQGIAPDVLPHIFERFVRADAARTRHTGGSGLGLSIALQIAERHGGRIEVFSREGLGSRFTVVLPLAE